MKLTKMHGLGNDFILFADPQGTSKDYTDLAIRLCDRRTGIGADGLAILVPSETCDVRMRIINSNGSEAEMCGNAIRCFAKYAYEHGETTKETFTIETLAGVMKPTLTIENGIVTQITVDMGKPFFKSQYIPMNVNLIQMVADQCKDAHIITVPQGEASKSFKILESVLKQMLEFGMGRGDLVIAVGGGVVGDLAGFAASIYMRGIDFINCPTTTLSMIDSSIGGKTAVDLGDTKNIVGAFWQPKLVIVDPDTLSTLPRRHFINGLAEAVKASLLADPELFAIFENGDVDAQIGEIICRSLRFKKNIVEQDETEQGMRKALNFGHTIGHGIEAVKGIKGRRTVGLYHGECVALGMLPMIESKALQKRVRAVYRRLGLPTRTTYDKEKVLAEMLHDKKAQSGQITIIKVPGLGCWRAETIPVEGLRPLLGIEE